MGSDFVFSFEGWLKQLTSLVFMAPLFIFFLYLTVKFLSIGIALNPTLPDAGIDNAARIFMDVLFPFALVYAILDRGRKLAKKMSGEFGELTSKFVGKAAGLALGGVGVAVGGVGGFVGRSVIGAGAGSLARNEGVQERLSKSWIGKQAFKGLVGLDNASFDFRSRKGIIAKGAAATGFRMTDFGEASRSSASDARKNAIRSREEYAREIQVKPGEDAATREAQAAQAKAEKERTNQKLKRFPLTNAEEDVKKAKADHEKALNPFKKFEEEIGKITAKIAKENELIATAQKQLEQAVKDERSAGGPTSVSLEAIAARRRQEAARTIITQSTTQKEKLDGERATKQATFNVERPTHEARRDAEEARLEQAEARLENVKEKLGPRRIQEIDKAITLAESKVATAKVQLSQAERERKMRNERIRSNVANVEINPYSQLGNLLTGQSIAGAKKAAYSIRTNNLRDTTTKEGGVTYAGQKKLQEESTAAMVNALLKALGKKSPGDNIVLSDDFGPAPYKDENVEPGRSTGSSKEGKTPTAA